MGLPPAAKEEFAKRHIDRTARAVTSIQEERAKRDLENRRAYERFYNNLALFSGGTVALSVTYLGYLKTLSAPVIHKEWLKWSWIAFVICIGCSLFWSFFISHYEHYAGGRQYSEAAKKQFETAAAEIEHLKLDNLQTEEELATFVLPRQKAAATTAKNAQWNARREKVYSWVWRWAGRVARFSFVAGIVLLIAFAIRNF